MAAGKEEGKEAVDSQEAVVAVEGEGEVEAEVEAEVVASLRAVVEEEAADFRRYFPNSLGIAGLFGPRQMGALEWRPVGLPCRPTPVEEVLAGP